MRTRGRLVLRIYLFSLLSALAAVGLVLLFLIYVEPAMRQLRASPPDEAADMYRARAEPDALAAAIEATNRSGHVITVYATDGTPIASAGTALPALTAAQVKKLGEQGVLRVSDRRLANALLDGGRMVAYGEYELSRPPFPSGILVAILIVVSILLMVAAVLFARSMARPLRTLGAAATAFGAGDLAARAKLTGNDEIGAVGDAFDAMADRVTTLVRSQQELMGNVAHELRTPMARIRVALELADEGDAELAREVLAGIDADLGDLERLVDDVLTSVRLDLAAPLHLDEVDVGELLASAADRDRAGRDRNPTEVDAPAARSMVRGDEALLRRVVGNLLDNAHKYSEPGTPITLRARAHDAHVRIEIADRGIGIDEADLASVFDPFFRSDRSRARKTGGVGLGLAIAKKIVVAHGGDISIASRPGAGTTVSVELPASPTPPAGAPS